MDIARVESAEASGVNNRSLDWMNKGLWFPKDASKVVDFVRTVPNLFESVCSWPVMVVQEDALEHNIGMLAKFCESHRLHFAPHGKTTMAPGIFSRQLAAGAWGITFATAHQVLVGRRFGVNHILLANELMDTAAIGWLVDELVDDPEFEFACFVDSVAGVHKIAEIAFERGLESGFPVLLDIGYVGGRTGIRTALEAYELAELIDSTTGIRLVGVSAYEGGLPATDAVRSYFAVVREVVSELQTRALLPAHPMLTAGGSAYFDLVADELGGGWAESLGLRVVLRSGAYVSHDEGIYKTKTPYNRMPGGEGLHAALEVWAQVLSSPEPGLAIVGMGKRDAPYDLGMPTPLRVRREGSTDQEALEHASIVKMDDHHGYLELAHGATPLQPGDLVCFGISHPCTAFDKWGQLILVGADYSITDVFQTYF